MTFFSVFLPITYTPDMYYTRLVPVNAHGSDKDTVWQMEDYFGSPEKER